MREKTLALGFTRLAVPALSLAAPGPRTLSLLPALWFASVLAGCAPAAPPSTAAPTTAAPAADAAPATSTTSTLDQVIAAHKVAVGIGYTAPPMNYLDADGNHVGFDLDLARAVVEKLSAVHGPIEIEVVRVDSQTRVTFLAAGRIDMTVSSMSHTSGRDEAIDFAEPPYLWVGKQFYAHAGRFKTVKDLIGKRIAVQQGSNAFVAGAQFLRENGDPEPRMMAFRTDGEALLALRQEKVEAFTQDNVILLGLLEGEAGQYEPVGPIYSPGLYSIGVGPNDSRWRDAVSFALQTVLKDGTYEGIYVTWFGPKGRYPLATNARPRLPEDAYGAGKPFIWPD